MNIMTSSTSPTALTESFEGIHNFRDFGGYPVASGGRLRNGLLYRSANYATASERDLETFLGLEIATIVDLRRPAERLRYPSRRHSICKAETVSYGDPTIDTEPPHLAHLGDPGIDEAVITQRMIKIYREFAFEPGHISVFRDAFAKLADSSGAIVLHCHAGKDRTGLIVALMHHVLGVGHDDMMHDYLLTNTVSRIEERLPDLAASSKEAIGRELPSNLLRHILRVEPEYLEAAFASIIAVHGSLDGYLSRSLGVTPAMRDALYERLIDRSAA